MEEINKDKVQVQVNLAIIKIGDVIRRKRIEKNLTQQSLAFYIFSDKCLISEIERGRYRNITILTLFKIANILEIDIKDYF